MLLVDANVLIDITAPDPTWADWSRARLAVALNDGDVAINQIVFAELAAGFDSIEELVSTISTLQLAMLPIPNEVCFRAGQVFAAYRRRGGKGSNVLADFFIGAHAEFVGALVLTRDPKRYRTYFPTVQLITPEPESP